jgi:hypothetical protein
MTAYASGLRFVLRICTALVLMAWALPVFAADDDKAEAVELPDEKPVVKPAEKSPEKSAEKPAEKPAPPPKREKKKKEKEEPTPRIEPEPAKESDGKPEAAPERPPQRPAEKKPEPRPAPPGQPEPRRETPPSTPPPVKAPPTDPPPTPKPVDPPPSPGPAPAPGPLAPTLENAEPGAETIPLPAERPKPGVPTKSPAATNPKTGTDPKAKPPEITEEPDAPELAVETPIVAPGESAVFSLYGPETYLRATAGRYLLRDEFGREIARGDVRVRELPYSEGKPRQFKLPITNPLAQRHEFDLSLTGPDGKQFQLRGTFNVPLVRTWENWIALVATPPFSPASASVANESSAWNGLHALGISGGMQYRLHPARRESLRKGGAAFYVENIARQLLSRYHTERGLWEKTIAEIAKDPNSRTALARDPSLCSPAFAEAFAKELKRHADVYAKDPPLFYSLASEPSLTRLSAAADFDFSPAAQQEFQRWLERDVYGTLKALNTSWGTSFASWTDVVPMTTDEARMRLSDGVMNVGPWMDFRDFQDFIFAKILRDGADYIRRSDPNAKVGITGALGPFAHGGWDWSRLARSLDVVECYDIGGGRAVWRDLAPGKPALAVVPLFEALEPREGSDYATELISNEASRTIWSLALEGGPRGVVLWDDAPGSQGADGKPAARALLDADGNPSALGKSLAPMLAALNGEAGALLAQSRRLNDGVAVLYSPASVRLHWLLEADKLHPKDWLQAWGADTSGERRESPQLRLRESWSKLLDDLGLGWRYISSSQIEQKEILKPESGIKTIVLPQAIALSDRESDVLHQFAAAGGKIIADATCGRFDEHGRVREKPALDDIFSVDTSREPFFPDPMNPLELISNPGGEKGALTKQNLNNLAPVFSDRPKRISASGPEYRRSPVVSTTKNGAFLNLDLTDYLRWRLHPDQPRAKAVRDILAGTVFADRLAESLIDWQRSQIPHGTQLVWLAPNGASGARILALQRNPQNRLHELGTESEGNWAFEKTEAFSVVLRAPVTVLSLPSGAHSTGLVQKIEGKLSPVTPGIFVLNTKPATPPKLTVPPAGRAGEALPVAIAASAPGAALYSIHVTAPDGSERPWLNATKASADGALSHAIPFALNDPPGLWKISVRDLVQGSEASVNLELKPAP